MVRASLYALFGVLAALLAALGGDYVPDALADRLGGSSVEAVLTILASSLLAVATFSLGAMVTAYTSVSSSATPRAAALVTGDESTQKSLATFVGAFLYSVVGVTAINAEYYGPGGRAILFILSLAVVALVAFRLLQALAEADDRQVEVLVRPSPDEERLTAYRDAFTLEADRIFDQDPRYGLIVLGEIAGKALSSGINDPGAAIQVIGAGARLLDDWAMTCQAAAQAALRRLDDPVERATFEAEAPC